MRRVLGREMNWRRGKPRSVDATVADAASEAPKTEWIEPATGHAVVRLSREPGTWNLSFHQNAYTAEGDKLIVTTPTGLAAINLKRREVEPLVEGDARQIVVGRKSRQVFYTREGSVFVTHLDTRATRRIAHLPAEIYDGAADLAVNADETLLVGCTVEGEPMPLVPSILPTQAPSPRPRPGWVEGGLDARLAARLPMRLYRIDITSGETSTIHRSHDWLNHVQCSPTDPTRILFCHEGPWHKVDRIWTMRTDGSDLQKIHTRTMPMEIAGHEFFSVDGTIIWYDLQTPRAKNFWLAGHELATGRQFRFRVRRKHWSVHYNASPDGKLFAGDGGGPSSVAAPHNGQWIYLFTPKRGVLRAERLVDLARHDYRTEEPNVSFTPDGNWIVFQSNVHGATHVYAVAVRKSQRPRLWDRFAAAYRTR